MTTSPNFHSMCYRLGPKIKIVKNPRFESSLIEEEEGGVGEWLANGVNGIKGASFAILENLVHHGLI